MFRLSLKLPANSFRKLQSPVIVTFREKQILRLYQTTSNRWKKIEGEKVECPPNKGSKGFYYTVGAVLVGTGAVVAYAKHDEDFRSWLQDNVPGSDQFISFVSFEETSPVDFFLRWFAETGYFLYDAIYSTITGTSGRKEALPPCDKDQQPYVPPKSAIANLKQDQPEAKSEVRTYNVEEDDVKIVKKEVEDVKKKVIEEVKKELLPTNLKELEDSINKAATIAVNSYTDAVCVLRALADEIYQLVESSVESVDPQVWPKIQRKTEEREKLLSAAETAAKKASSRIKELQGLLNDPKFPGNQETKENVRRNLRRTIDSVEDAKKTFQQEISKMAVTDRYWSKVQEARRHFSEELEILFPNVRLNDKKMKLAEGELDLFILYAYQNILYYQKELSKLDTLAQRRLQEALVQSKLGDPQAIDAVIEQEIDKEKRKIGLEFQKRMLGLKSSCEADMRLQMKRQADAHSDHLREVVDMKEKELDRKLQRAIDERLEREKAKFKEEVAAMVARLKGIDDVIKCRAKADRRMRASQSLWSACQALESALRGPPHPAAAATELIRPLEDEISAIIKSADKEDELVDVVVSSIPREARSRGVYPEPVLRERFLGVERVAKRVALLPEGGASLPVMLLSYLQSFLILSPASPIPSYELAGEPVEVSNFNTFEILQRARYWVDRGDFAQALRYMNLLDGAASVVARDWCNEIRIFLETQQAAAVLMAHASAAGLTWA